MPDFAYTARDVQGQRVTGTVSATSEREVLAILSSQSLFPVNVAAAKQAGGVQFRRRVSGQLMAVTYAQLASLLRSGVPLLRSLAVLRDQTSHRVLKEVLEDVHHRVEDGATLADAMARYPRVFSDLAMQMVRAGGEGGFLEEALDRVAQFTEQSEDLRSRTVGALAYPVFLSVVGTLVVTVLIVFFVPRFATIFESLRKRGELPAVTEWLLAFSEGVRSWGLLLLLVFGVAAVLLRAQLITERGRRMVDLCKLQLAPHRRHLSESRRGALLSRPGNDAAEWRADPQVARGQPGCRGESHPVASDRRGFAKHLGRPVPGQAVGGLRAFPHYGRGNDLGGRRVEHARHGARRDRRRARTPHTAETRFDRAVGGARAAARVGGGRPAGRPRPADARDQDECDGLGGIAIGTSGC